MLQVTPNQNTSPCQHTTNTHSPTPITHCLTATSNTNNTSDHLGNTGNAFCSCQTVCGNASLPLGNRRRSGDRTGRIETCVVLEECSAVHPWGMEQVQTVHCWSQKVLQYSHGGWSEYRRCFAGARRFCSKCRKLPAVAVTVPCCSPSQLCGQMTVTTPHTANCTPHTAAKGRQAWGTSQGHLDNNGQSFA
jgi:hypothetical protein